MQLIPMKLFSVIKLSIKAEGNKSLANLFEIKHFAKWQTSFGEKIINKVTIRQQCITHQRRNWL